MLNQIDLNCKTSAAASSCNEIKLSPLKDLLHEVVEHDWVSPQHLQKVTISKATRKVFNRVANIVLGLYRSKGELNGVLLQHLNGNMVDLMQKDAKDVEGFSIKLTPNTGIIL